MDNKPKFAVLGAGNGGVATAADLTVRGFDVNLWEHPDFEIGIRPIQEAGGITLDTLPSTGLSGGFAQVKLITSDIEKALDGVDAVLVIVPSFAHKRFAELCAPYIQDGQTVIVMPGNFGGALEFYNAFKKKNDAKNVSFAEAECMIYACRKESPAKIWIRGFKHGLRIAAVPAIDNDRVMNLIQQAYPKVLPGQNIIETGLSNPNPIQHTPIMILNAGLIDRTRGNFLFYKEGMTPKTADVTDAIDAERLAVGKAFKTKMRTMFEQDVEWYGYQGAKGSNIYESTMNNDIYQWSKAPDSFQHRYLTEDIPFGLAALEELGNVAGIPTPITTSMIDLAQILTEKNLRENRRSLEALGLNNMSASSIVDFITNGN